MEQPINHIVGEKRENKKTKNVANKKKDETIEIEKQFEFSK